MLQSAKWLLGYQLDAEDSTLGSVHDLYFDDQLWEIRYLVAKTISLIGRKVLIAPAALGTPNWPEQALEVNLTKDQIKASPGADLHLPVSKQVAADVNDYYGWPVFKQRDQLRSIREVKGYRIAATDGDIGHVEDFILDVEAWAIHRLVVDTRNLLPGKKVMIAPTEIDRLSCGNRSVYVNLTCEEVRESPQFNASEPVNELIKTVRTDYRGVPRRETSGVSLI